MGTSVEIQCDIITLCHACYGKSVMMSIELSIFQVFGDKAGNDHYSAPAINRESNDCKLNFGIKRKNMACSVQEGVCPVQKRKFAAWYIRTFRPH